MGEVAERSEVGGGKPALLSKAGFRLFVPQVRRTPP